MIGPSGIGTIASWTHWPILLYWRLSDFKLTWWFFWVWNFKKYKVASTLFFQGLDHIFSACNLQSEREEARLPLLFVNNKKMSWPCFLQVYLICTVHLPVVNCNGNDSEHCFDSDCHNDVDEIVFYYWGCISFQRVVQKSIIDAKHIHFYSFICKR